MKRVNRNNWTAENIEFLRANAHLGYTYLAAHFNYSDGGIRSVTAKHKIKVMSAKDIRFVNTPDKKEEPPRQQAQFILQETLPGGACKVWIPSEKISLTVPPGKDPQTAVDKIVFRHARLKFE